MAPQVTSAPLAIDVARIGELATPVPQAGALRAAEIGGDDLFEYIIGVAILSQGNG